MEDPPLTQQEVRQLLQDVAAQGSTIRNMEKALEDISEAMHRVTALEERIGALQREVQAYHADTETVKTEVNNVEQRLKAHIDSNQADTDARLSVLEAWLPLVRVTSSFLFKVVVRVTGGGILIGLGYLLSSKGVLA